MAEKEYPVYRFIVKEDGTNTGMVGISLVDEPAIMSDWQYFNNEEEQPKFIALKDENGEYKQEILGAALRPDLAILRKDDAGNFYYGVFEKETIEIIRNKFHKQKNTSEVNLMHDSDLKVDAYLIESYIIQNEEQLTATKSMGLEDIEIGAWIVRYKVESEEVFKDVVEKLNGFSIEILLERELINMSKNNFNKQNNSIMSKFNELLNRFKTVLSEFEEETPSTPTAETELEDVTVAESDMVLRYTEVGSPVLEVTTDENGEEATVGASEGEYILEDGRTLVVDAEGNLVEIKEAEEESEPVAEEDMNSDSTDGTPNSEENLEETSTEETEKTDLNKTLAELIPTDSDGTYQLEVYVSEGKMSFGTLYAYTYKDLKLSELIDGFEKLKQEKEELNKEVEKLQAELDKPVGTPVFTELKEEKTKKKRSEFKNNLEYQLHRLGLDDE